MLISSKTYASLGPNYRLSFKIFGPKAPNFVGIAIGT
jgi:hypothetical protein